jgi:hypothetical protein
MAFIDIFLKYIFYPIILSIVGLLFVIYPNEKFVLIIVLIYATTLMVNLFIKTIHVKGINLFILFAFSYLIPLYYYSFANKIITSYSHSNELTLLIKYTLIYSLFFTVIAAFLPNIASVRNSGIYKRDNFIIFYFNVGICLIIAFFSKSGESLLSSGGYGQSEISNLGGFAIGEYFLIFFFVAFRFSGTLRINKFILIIIAGIYIIESLAFGLRNEFIQLSILLFILYFRESGKSFGYFAFILLGLYFSSLFAAFRSNPISFLESSIVENLSLSNVIDNESDNYISHQGDVIHSSSRLINFRDNNITSNGVIYSSAALFFSSAIIPQKYLPEQANMAAYRKDDYPAGGGGNLFAYFYFWFWYPGVILIASFIGLLIRNYAKYLNSIYGAYIILVFSTFPRWFSYSPINLFKMCLYTLIIYFIFLSIDRYMKESGSQNSLVN